MNETVNIGTNKMLPARLRLMRKIRQKIKDELESVQSNSSWGGLIDEWVFKMITRRVGKIGIRGLFTYTVYEYVLSLEKKEDVSLNKDLSGRLFDTQIPFLLESVISLNYLDNQILDGKGNVTTSKAINENLLSRNIFSLLLRRDYITKMDLQSSEERDLVLHYYDKMLEFVDIGQVLEKRLGTYTVFKSGLPAPNETLEQEIPSHIKLVIDDAWFILCKDHVKSEYEYFIKLYFKRVYLCCASPFVFAAELIMDLLKYNGPNRKNITRFASYYGMLIQFVNDNNDYLPFETIEKVPEDVFSDLRNETMSLPLIYYLGIETKRGRKNEDKKSFNELQKMATENGQKCMKELLETLLDCSIPFAQEIALRAESLIDRDTAQYVIFADMLGIASRNKFNYEYNLHTP